MRTRSLTAAQCHAPENIEDEELRIRPKTFLGLDQTCVSCHDDFHQGTMSKNCLNCHGMDAFKPASAFDHDKTDFKLKGSARAVWIARNAMQVTTENGKQFQVFADVPHADCKACHDDPHQAHFANACSQCHTEQAFTTFAGKDRFDHNPRSSS